MSDTVTQAAAGGGGGGSIGVNGTMCFDTKMLRSASASLRALDIGSVTSSLKGIDVSVWHVKFHVSF